MHDIEKILSAFVARHELPEAYTDTARRWFLPLAEEISLPVHNKGLKVLGIVGCQGSGKSTLAALLAELVDQVYHLKVAVLSLDDFYHTQARRQQLGQEIHPLLRTRGVPGTHDLNLAAQTIDALLHEGHHVAIPRFDKARDDRRPKSQWEVFTAPADLVILEGWCLAARPQPEADLIMPINELEAKEDADGRWRRYVNHHLDEDYRLFFQRIDTLIGLVAPNFQCVYRWRRHQEQQLEAENGAAIMDDEALRRFVQHFERITRYNLPYQAKADVVFRLDENQRVVKREDNDDA